MVLMSRKITTGHKDGSSGVPIDEHLVCIDGQQLVMETAHSFPSLTGQILTSPSVPRTANQRPSGENLTS